MAGVAAPLPVLLMLALSLGGCSSGGGDDAPDPTVSPAPTSSPTPTSVAPQPDPVTAVDFRDHPELGPILVDQDGRTLYVFTNDDPGVSKCFGQCASNWPPALAGGDPDAPDAIDGDIATVARGSDQQVAHRNRPLYYWQGDDQPGDATGDGFGGIWFVVREPAATRDEVWANGTMATEGADVVYHNTSVGFHAKPVGASGAPGIVMVHEWWGLTPEMRAMADSLASHGYQVLAVDLFAGQVATTPQQAMAQVQALDQAEATANLRAAAAYLRSQGASEVASLGWCFGGGQSLQLAISGEQLAATVVYYGTPLPGRAQLANVTWPVLGVFAEKDSAIPVPDVRAFEEALRAERIENQVLIYPDVGHAFANPSGEAWAPQETHDAWQRTLAFLDKNLG